MKQIPNLFTLLNLIFGCFAIVMTLQFGLTVAQDEEGAQLVMIPERIWYASLCIGLAALVDFLDGFVARWLKATSEMGKQLDSLADVVSFGVAPSVIIYHFLRLSLARETDGLEASSLWLAPSFIVAGAAAWRLAKFNVSTDQQHGFKGVPTPAVGLLVASLPLIYWDSSLAGITQWFLNIWFWYGFILGVSILMVSNIPLLAFKFNGGGVKALLPLMILALAGVVAAYFVGWLAVPVVFLLYILLSLRFKNR